MKELFEMRKEFRNEYLPKWKEKIQLLFDNNIPIHYEWKDLNEIVYALNKIGSKKGINHMFYPRGGGLDLYGASMSSYKGCIELNSNGFIEICKPQNLVFENIDNDFEWCYFRLNLEKIDSCLKREEDSEDERMSEELWEVGHNDFEPYSDFRPSDGSRRVIRLLKGSLIIVAKASAYNLVFADYCGTDNKYNDEIFLKKMKHNKTIFDKNYSEKTEI